MLPLEVDGLSICVGVQDADGSKIVNEYVRKHKVGSGSYGKVVSTYNFICASIQNHDVKNVDSLVAVDVHTVY